MISNKTHPAENASGNARDEKACSQKEALGQKAARSREAESGAGTDEKLRFEVTDSPPEWSRPSLSAKGGLPARGKDQPAVEIPAGGPYFYIDADVSRGWPGRSREALCKLGVTGKPPAFRCRENEKTLRQEWEIEADLRVVFVATGHITTVEKEIVDYTLPWLLEPFEKNAEWRCCPPRELARVATLIAEKRFRSGYR